MIDPTFPKSSSKTAGPASLTVWDGYLFLAYGIYVSLTYLVVYWLIVPNNGGVFFLPELDEVLYLLQTLAILYVAVGILVLGTIGILAKLSSLNGMTELPASAKRGITAVLLSMPLTILLGALSRS